MVTNLDPEFELAYVNRGNIFLKTYLFNKAIQDFKKAEAINPKLSSLVTQFDSLNKKSINFYRLLSGRLNLPFFTKSDLWQTGLNEQFVNSFEYREIFPDLPAEDLGKIVRYAN